MIYRIFMMMFLAGAMMFPAPSHAQPESTENTESRNMGDSVVRYDVLDVAKNLMSCSGYYHVMEEPEQSAFFRDETKYIFMMDAAQTEEETAGWLAGASQYYKEFWTHMNGTETVEAAESMERHRRECVNLQAAQTDGSPLTVE